MRMYAFTYYLKRTLIKKQKKRYCQFKRIVGTCEGKEKIKVNKIKQWVEKRDTLRNTYIIDFEKLCNLKLHLTTGYIDTSL